MPPIVLLIGLIVLTACAVLASTCFDRARSGKIAALASTWGMGFTAEDRFQLTTKVAGRFPIPGAADLALEDLVYRQESAGFRYLFTVGYTTGILRTKRRRRGVAMFIECDRNQEDSDAQVILAPQELPLRAQYEWLYEQKCCNQQSEPAKAAPEPELLKN
jgi:hypothetical protein